jgi:hypothetical protein
LIVVYGWGRVERRVTEVIALLANAACEGQIPNLNVPIIIGFAVKMVEANLQQKAECFAFRIDAIGEPKV